VTYNSDSTPSFVDANRDELTDAVLLRLDGVGVSLPGALA
jgi:hypothetical protein